MSTTWEDFSYDEYMKDQYIEDLVNKSLKQFSKERLISYYQEKVNIALPSINALNTAKSLLEINPTAALLFAAISQEYTIKYVFIQPLVYGLINNEYLANIIATFTIRYSGPSRYKKLLQQLLEEHSGVDLENYNGVQKKNLWDDICDIEEKRNCAVHEALIYKYSDAEYAIKVAEVLLNSIFPKIMNKLGIMI